MSLYNNDSEIEGYWRRKFDALQAESTAATIRSLRAQLRTIKRLAQENEPDALRSILVHCQIGLEIDR